MPSESTNKRIAKNTLLLYVRILLTMVIGLYTSRVVLAELGISDYGLYSVVGGIVTMFTFINGSLNAGTQRFLTFELGRGDIVQLKKLFSTAIVIYTFLAMIILFLAETIGLWFLLNKMNFAGFGHSNHLIVCFPYTVDNGKCPIHPAGRIRS